MNYVGLTIGILIIFLIVCVIMYFYDSYTGGKH